jgi:hypothetical protein
MPYPQEFAYPLIHPLLNRGGLFWRLYLGIHFWVRATSLGVQDTAYIYVSEYDYGIHVHRDVREYDVHGIFYLDVEWSEIASWRLYIHAHIHSFLCSFMHGFASSSLTASSPLPCKPGKCTPLMQVLPPLNNNILIPKDLQYQSSAFSSAAPLLRKLPLLPSVSSLSGSGSRLLSSWCPGLLFVAPGPQPSL